jgi:hypothetical protein
MCDASVALVLQRLGVVVHGLCLQHSELAVAQRALAVERLQFLAGCGCFSFRRRGLFLRFQKSRLHFRLRLKRLFCLRVGGGGGSCGCSRFALEYVNTLLYLFGSSGTLAANAIQRVLRLNQLLVLFRNSSQLSLHLRQPEGGDVT